MAVVFTALGLCFVTFLAGKDTVNNIVNSLYCFRPMFCYFFSWKGYCLNLNNIVIIFVFLAFSFVLLCSCMW